MNHFYNKIKIQIDSNINSTLMLSLFTVLFLISCTSGDENNSEYITIGTFNIAWLGDGVDDTNPRNDKDYKNIAGIISNTGVDIIGLEEIENEGALEKLTSYLNEYSYFVGQESEDQNPAILYKNNIQVNFLKYIDELEVVANKTKPGILFEVKKGNFDWLMMVVHFKSTSRYDSTEELKEQSRIIRESQTAALSNWIDSVITNGTEKDIVIVGDFNDYPTRISDATLTKLVENKNIEFLSSGMKSCKYDYMYSIDHIIVSLSVKSRYLDNSIRMYNFFDSLTDTEAEKISDHCPVLATFNISKPDND